MEEDEQENNKSGMKNHVDRGLAAGCDSSE